ncbi:hypothetical protein VP01_257g5 [Puccinia sorghi]|uniref:DNA/RNA-binding domain-containing protein n=1 Tax=Puccinia sorghi TaxID=27349 RepID=A0A0L6V5H5_9BASI|nr:hypothetical protein VP01_257g5 [Puccinia sorghi]
MSKLRSIRTSATAHFLPLFRQIKSLASTIKELLLNQEPWSSTIEYHRQRYETFLRFLRQQYLAFIFQSPGQATSSSPSATVKSYAGDALHLLWLDTSYSLINIYRNKLSAIDKEIERATLVNHKKSCPKNQRIQTDRIHGSPSGVGPVARRKLLQQFRSFLRTEDTFWKSLIHRLINYYHVDAATGCLKILKIFNDHPAVEGSRTSESPDSQHAQQAESKNLPPSATEGILLVHKALICFGDLIRYGELYARTGRQASPFSGPKSHSREKLDKTFVVERDWSRSQDCYAQARLLIPTNGNPSNQLAILSSYIPDVLSSVYHYYRALCVKNPFPTARQNLEGSFTKALAKLKQTDPSMPGSAPQELPSGSSEAGPIPENSVLGLKSRFVAIHASLYTQATNPFPDCNLKLCSEFASHLKDRLLPPELILRMAATCMAAVWYARICVGTAVTRSRNGDHPDSRAHPAARSYTTEVNATVHFLQFSAALLSVAKDELVSIDDSSFQGDLSLKIPAVLRRILPAMRIISKWVLSGHFDHINRVKLRLSRSKKLKLNSQLVTAEAEFWTQYHQAIEFAKHHFPIDRLPSLDDSVGLEEDFELAGFLPIERARKVQDSASPKPFKQFTSPAPCGAYHPNEEHLMRLGDLQRDAHRIEAKHFGKETPNLAEPNKSARVTNVGLNQIENHHRPDLINSPTFSPSTPPRPAEADPAHPVNAPSDEYDNLTDDEDPVELAMRAVVAQQMGTELASSNHNTPMLKSLDNSRDAITDEDDDDDDDVILYLTNPTNGTANRPESSNNTAGLSATAQLSSGLSATARFSSSLDPTPVEQVGSSMSTAADLLASIISAPMATPKNCHDPNAAVASLVPVGKWTPFSSVDQIFPGLPLRTSATVPPPRHGRRIPSVSLPKPAEASVKTNIWSTLPASNSCSPMQPNMIMASDWPASAAFLSHSEEFHEDH